MYPQKLNFNDTRMTISVIMSVYESEKDSNLDRALQSIWDDQTLRPTEIILVQDGPLPQDTLKVISHWKKKLGEVLHILKNEVNLGLTISLNKALKVAKCDLIARMDSDDISLPDRFRKQEHHMSNHPETSILGGSIQEFDDHNDCIYIRHYPLSNEAVISTIHKASPLAHPAVIFRRSFFTDGHCYNEKYRKSQDLELWFEAVSNGYKINNLEDPIVKFRRTPDMFRRRGSKSARMEFEIYMKGIYHMNGIFTFKYIYPLSRFIFRLLPHTLIKKIYESGFRNKITR